MDIFLWANQTDAIKHELEVDFFFFNKNHTPYHINRGSSIETAIKPLFLFDVLNTINLGAGTGLAVRGYEDFDDDGNTILCTPLEEVDRASNLIHFIEHERDDILEFSQEEHEFKCMKGIVAVFSHVDGQQFYITKSLGSGVSESPNAWEICNGKLEILNSDVVFRVPVDNHALIVNDYVFAFSVPKFEAMFNFEQTRKSIIDQKIAEIEKMYQLSFPDGLDLAAVVYSRKKAMAKLVKMEIGAVSHSQAAEYADEIGLELMTDDIGGIIIMDGSDLDVFLNLINEDYATNEITGRRYEIKSKKELVGGE